MIFGLILFATALIVAFIKRRRPGNTASVAQLLWSETLFYGVGGGFLWAGFFHAFFPDLAAPAIGWAPSPFEWELAWAEFGIAAMAFWSLWRGNEFRLPVTLIFAVFSFGAAFQHIHQIVCCANNAPGNAGVMLWFGDIVLPGFLLAAAYVAAREPQTRER